MFLASVNAGVLRILTPTCHRQAFLREAATAKEVIVSRGFWPIAGDDGIEILFDDHSETPYALHIVGAACRPMISRSEDGKCVKVSLWSLRNGRIQLEAEFNGRFRVTPRIPWGRRW